MVFSLSIHAFAAEPIQIIVIGDSQSYTVFSSTQTNYGTMYFVKDNKPQPRSLWDFVDIAMAGASWYDLIKDSSLKNLSWAVLDTAAIAPLIPSNRWIRQGSKYLIPIKEIKKLASTSSGKSKLLKAMKVTKPLSKLDDGKTPLKKIKVILDKNGYVVTAFPVK